MNKMIIIGNLTRDPETRTTPSGHSVCSFDVAVNDRKGDSTTYFRVSVWDKMGAACQQYLSKGKKVFASGSLTARTYQGNDGSTRVSLEINASDVEFLSGRDQGEQPTHNAPPAPAMQNGYVPVDEEVPF